MSYLVTLEMANGKSATVNVFATNTDDAEYRAAYKAESLYGAVVRVIKCNRTR